MESMVTVRVSSASLKPIVHRVLLRNEKTLVHWEKVQSRLKFDVLLLHYKQGNGW